MPDLAAPAPRATPVDAARVREEGPLWPWITRFFWAPAQDLHPSRRASVAAELPAEVWQSRASLRHVSRYLLRSAALTDMPQWHKDARAFQVALLPAEALNRLARRMSLALRGAPLPADPQSELSAEQLADEAQFATQRAGLYWVAAHDSASWPHPPDVLGWLALREAVATQPEAVRRRFAWKLPLACDEQGWAGAPSDAMLALALRILREFEEPWCTLFAKAAR